MKHHIIFLVFALVIFHKYRPEQRIPSFFSSTRTFRINFQEVLFQTPAPPPTTQQVVVWYAKSCIIKLSSWDRSVVLEQKYFHGPVVPNTFWRLLLCENKQPSWTRNRKVKNIGPKRWKKVWNKKQKSPLHSRLLVTESQKWATHMNKEEAIMSKYSHIHWTVIACAKSCEKSQCKTKSLESASTPWITRRWLSYVILSSWVHELFGCLRHKVFEEFSDCTFFLHPTLF